MSDDHQRGAAPGDDSGRTYQLTLTEAQARILSAAAELLCEIHRGKLSEIAFACFAGLVDVDRFCELRDRLQELEPLASGLPRNQFWGIRNRELHESARVAYDLHQVLRHRLWWDHNRGDAGAFRGVDSDPPMRTARDVPLAVMDGADALPTEAWGHPVRLRRELEELIGTDDIAEGIRRIRAWKEAVEAAVRISTPNPEA